MDNASLPYLRDIARLLQGLSGTPGGTPATRGASTRLDITGSLDTSGVVDELDAGLRTVDELEERTSALYAMGEALIGELRSALFTTVEVEQGGQMVEVEKSFFELIHDELEALKALHIREILSHLSVGRINEGTSSEIPYLLADIGFASDSFVTAGGVGPGSGGSGIDLGAMWTSLSNQPVATADVTDTTKIALAHIPTASAIGSGVTGLVSGSLLYGILGDSFDASFTVKGFINSSIATATATFRGTNTTATTEAGFLLWADALTHDLNDYVFWATEDEYGVPVYKRYKYDGTSWEFEYNLNNSSYTTAQWAAINSGITATKVGEYEALMAYFDANGLLGPTHGGTGIGAYAAGALIYASATNVLTTLAANSGGKKFLTMASSVPSWGGIEDTDLPAMYIGSTAVQYDTDPEALTGITTASLSDTLTLGGGYAFTGTVGTPELDLTRKTHRRIYFGSSSYYLELDESGYLHTNAGFYSDSFVTAGGVGTGGGGGGIDLGAMWSSLVNADIATADVASTTKIHTAHLPNLSAAGGLTASYTSTGSGASLATTLNIGVDDNHHLPTLSEWAGIPSGQDMDIVSKCLQSLQCQIDSVASLCSSDELTVAVIYADTLAVSAGYIAKLETGGITLGGTAFGSSAGVAQWAGSDLFSGLSSSAGANISVVVGGKTRTATLYATYDSAGENISDKFGVVGTALQSLQAQIDSVASRSIYDELTAAAVFADMLTASAGYFGTLYGELNGNAATASYLVGTTYGVGSTVKPIYFSGGRPAECAYAFGNQAGNVPISNGTINSNLYANKAQLDSDGYNIASQFTTVSAALQSLQAQVDSVASLCGGDEVKAAAGYFDTLAVGAGIYAGSVLATGYVTAGAASDRRLKTDVRTLTTDAARAIIMGLRPVTFHWNELAANLCGEYKGDDIGMIAQEVEAVMPWAVGTIFDTYKRLDYSKIVTPLVGIAQDHERRLLALERAIK